jgi:hypothetical protein
MKEYPILFNDEAVRAILKGKKTQTRRPVKPQPMGYDPALNDDGLWEWCDDREPRPEHIRRCPYGQLGDRLWVRETVRAEELESGLDGVRYYADDAFIPIENSIDASDRWCDLYYYDYERRGCGGWVPSIHMPRWACRQLLDVTGIRVERLQEIHSRDVHKEGIICAHCQGLRDQSNCTCVKRYAAGWNAIYADKGLGWDANPWVWVIQFRREDQ